MVAVDENEQIQRDLRQRLGRWRFGSDTGAAFPGFETNNTAGEVYQWGGAIRSSPFPR